MRFKGVFILFLLFLILPLNEVFAGGCFVTDINGNCLKWDQSQTIYLNFETGCLTCSEAVPPSEEKTEAENYQKTCGDSPFDFCNPFGGSCQLSKAIGEDEFEIENAEAKSMVMSAAAQWMSVPGAYLDIQQGEDIPVDLSLANYTNYYVPDQLYHPSLPLVKSCYDGDPDTPCFNPIVFDPYGLIIEDLLGGCAQYSVWGLGGISPRNYFEDPILKKGQLVINGACVGMAKANPLCPSGCPRVLTMNDMKAVVLHELGHVLGLDHTQLATSGTVNVVKVIGPPALAQSIPTMYPELVEGAGQETLHLDDQVAFARMYPHPANPNPNGYCTASGVVQFPGGAYLRCAEVVARDMTDPNGAASSTFHNDSVSFISGANAPKNTVDGAESKAQSNCSSNGPTGCSQFELGGLKPGHTYRLDIQVIEDPSFTIDPCLPPASNYFPKTQARVGGAEIICAAAGQKIKNLVLQTNAKN